MTNLQINKAIRNIIGAPDNRTYTDPRKNGRRAKFTFGFTHTKEQAQNKLKQVRTFLKKNYIRRTADLHYWEPIGSRYVATGWTIVTHTT